MYNGKERLLYLLEDETYLVVACLLGNTFSEGVDVLDTTTRDNNGWKTQVLTNQFFTVDFTGIQINTAFSGGDFSRVSHDRLKQIKRAREVREYKLATTDGVFVELFKAQITSLSDVATVDEFLTFDVSMLGFGEPVSTTEAMNTLGDGLGNEIQDGNNNNIQV